MLEELGSLPAPSLGLDEYRRDLQRNFWQADVTWKVERRLTIRGPGSPSWVAMKEGDWEGSLRLAEGMRAARAEHQRALDRRGIVRRRVRLVCEPPTAYLLWRLHVLTIRAEPGEQVKVPPTAAVALSEARGELPEVLILGERVTAPVMYVIQYTAGVLSGARKFTDPDLIGDCRREVAAHWRCGEDLLVYFPRRIEGPASPEQVQIQYVLLPVHPGAQGDTGTGTGAGSGYWSFESWVDVESPVAKQVRCFLPVRCRCDAAAPVPGKNARPGQ